MESWIRHCYHNELKPFYLQDSSDSNEGSMYFPHGREILTFTIFITFPSCSSVKLWFFVPCRIWPNTCWCVLLKLNSKMSEPSQLVELLNFRFLDTLKNLSWKLWKISFQSNKYYQIIKVNFFIVKPFHLVTRRYIYTDTSMSHVQTHDSASFDACLNALEWIWEPFPSIIVSINLFE